MLLIRQSQMEQLASRQQQSFVKKMAEHLNRVCRDAFPDRDAEFGSDEALARLDVETNYLLKNGITKEADLASAIELFELADVDPYAPDIRRIIEDKNNTGATEKLERLCSASRKGGFK